MRDPYTVLGLSKTATADEIKKAFRRLAKKFHPDQNKADPKAKDKFAEANQAYEILGDEKKKGQFDRGEIDAEGKPRFEGFGAGPGGFRRSGGSPGGFEHFEFNTGSGGPFSGGAGSFEAGDILSELFGGARPRSRHRASARGMDVGASVTVSLRQAIKGGSARVALPTGRTLEVTIPAGIEDGRQIRLKGQGQASPSQGEAGDAIVTVRVESDPVFRQDGRDLRMDLPVTLYEAVLGGKVPSPTLDGPVELSVPPNSANRTLRLRGKGLPAAGGQPAGDLLVTLRVALPDKDADVEALARRLRDERPYDPRKGLA